MTENVEWLGNFGFLLKFQQEFLFELGKNAESCLYVNKRLCAVYIRQFMEAFFNNVIDDFNINVIDFITPPPNDSRYEPRLSEKQKAISLFFKSCVDNKGDPYYLKHVFPVFPGGATRLPRVFGVPGTGWTVRQEKETTSTAEGW